MKFFLIELLYTVPIEKIDEAVVEHRNFLQTLYDKGILLLSGPKEPRIGGVILGKSKSLQEIQDIFQNDPFQKYDYASYKFTEFSPVKRQTFLEDWIQQK
ncbi:hypothetical protein LEP1GSC050_2844 [Leptospira broomii serovar Hurstbridge str. 5399]|uniref:YCII-related domain-containing protein n=1 Tax=Leptospira broomii serovar Hurstbridge str. 5399 TaxID=1049789 RepID=T0GFX2_9LEPT|nr:YciI family protein [Leptospira broomii]EQA45734.1 hypothetical protein LEP1GSC050_2844 [Leptospira broomii serovar Hurstbridge str. 5399]